MSCNTKYLIAHGDGGGDGGGGDGGRGGGGDAGAH